MVTMADGSEKRLDQVVVGDRVQSGLTGGSAQVAVVDVIPVLSEPMAMFGFNGLPPFSTTTHCFFTAEGARTSVDPAASVQSKHWEPAPLPLQNGSAIKTIRGLKSVTEIQLSSIVDTTVYNLITSDHSYVVNGYCVSDDFPDLLRSPTATMRIGLLLQRLERLGVDPSAIDYRAAIEAERGDRAEGIDYSTIEQVISTFMQQCQKNKAWVRIADDLWKYEFDTLNK